MSKKIALAEWKARAELAEAKLDHVMDLLRLNHLIAEEQTAAAKAHEQSVYDLNQNVLCDLASFQLKT